ncbi:MAG: energy transducer TonB, partial [Bacteroidales bacterium]|nr:energy transducer TonB [Bacteroidales bacterium]
DGSVTGISIFSSVFPSLDREAVRLINLTDKMWLPGMQGGKPVSVKLILKVEFKL